MSLLIVAFAGAIIALSNLAMRKSMDGGQAIKGFLVFQMSSACIFSIFLNPFRTGDYGFNAPIACFGFISGVILICMLFFLGKALEKGPPGFTFSLLSAGTVMPAILMAVFFGAGSGFPYTFWHGLGSLFVLGGLFWGGMGVSGLRDFKKWFFFSFLMFFLHVALLTLFQWRAFLLKIPNMEEVVSFLTSEQIKSQWFLPFMFLGAALIQAVIYFSTEKRRFTSREVCCGVLGGAANSMGVFFLIYSTEIASPIENAVIFPIYSVATIILSNLWGQKLYDEKVNWKACQLCAFGLVIGTVDWNRVVNLIGF